MKTGDRVRVGQTTPSVFVIASVFLGGVTLRDSKGFEFEFTGTVYPERRTQEQTIKHEERRKTK